MLKGCLRVGFLWIAAATVALAQRPPNLVGTWVGSFQGFPVEMVLNADGTGTFSGDPTQWRVQGVKLVLTSEDGSEAFDYRLQGSQLVLSGGDLVTPMTFTRSGAAATPGRAPEVVEEPATPPTPEPKPAARKRAMAEAEVIQLLEGSVPSRRIVELVEERGISFAVTPSLTSRLKAKGATPELIAVLRGAGGQETLTEPTPGASAGAAAPARPAIGSGGGPRYTQNGWGVSFAPPPGWKVAERQGALLLGSDTEAGLIVVRFVRGTNLQTLAADYQEGLEEEGLRLMPASQPENFSAGSSQGLAGELAGMSNDGHRIRARVIAVATPFGDAPVVLGLTTEEKYAQLRPRVESLARSLTFSRPQAPAVNESAAGQYIYFYSSSIGGSYSRQEVLNLCSNGMFNRGGETYSSGTNYGLAGQSGSGGRWSAEGGQSGTLILTFNDGRTQQFSYQKSGLDIVLDGRKYARYGDGSCTQKPPF